MALGRSPARKSVSSTKTHRTFAHINMARLKVMLGKKGYEVIPDFIACSCIEATCTGRAIGLSRPFRVPLVLGESAAASAS